jgi:2-alkenal reductase
MRPPATIAAIAGFAAGVVAALLTAAVVASTGTFDHTSTVLEQTSGLSPVTASIPSGPFDAGAIYRSRIRGVVTITSIFPTSEAGGSGFVVSSDGLILTNAHVVTNSADEGVAPTDVTAADRVYVRLSDGNQVAASVVGFDLFSDVAVLRADTGGQRLTPVPLGDSSQVQVGQPVAAIGSPFLEAGSLSVGVVSAVNRSLSSGTGFAIPGAIQTDAAINHGNSGGPLFNSAGQVIGINAQIQSTSGGGEGVGFAVPIDLAKYSMTQIVQNGHVAYGWLGVRLSSVTPTIADHFGLSTKHGALVVEVTAGGPADRAGLRAGGSVEQFQEGSIKPGGDVIVSVDGRPVASSDQFIRLVAEDPPGKVLHLQVVRSGQRRAVDVTLGTRPL